MNKPRRVVWRKDENLAAIGTGGKFSFLWAGLESELTKSSYQSALTMAQSMTGSASRLTGRWTTISAFCSSRVG
jgi:hypothetical protein